MTNKNPNQGLKLKASADPLTIKRRVRTGDEKVPDCLNCIKSHRICRRGLRLNFIEINVAVPDFLIEYNANVGYTLCDESRDIASEYEGGLARYGNLRKLPDTPPNVTPDSPSSLSRSKQNIASPKPSSGLRHLTQSTDSRPFPGDRLLPGPLAGIPIGSIRQKSRTAPNSPAHAIRESSEPVEFKHYAKPPNNTAPPQNAVVNPHIMLKTDKGILPNFGVTAPTQFDANIENAYSTGSTITLKKLTEPITDSQTAMYVQCYLHHVSPWLDILSPRPIVALTEPAILNCLAACGSAVLSMACPDKIPGEVPLKYYNNSTQILLKRLVDSPRNLELCTVTSLLLVMYEMLLQSTKGERHLLGMRALVQEFRWEPSSSNTYGISSTIGESCFWVSMSADIMLSFRLNQPTIWSPYEWGSMLERHSDEVPSDDWWFYKIMFIVSRVLNFRRRNHVPSYHEHIINAKYHEWLSLSQDLFAWERDLPITMRPIIDLPQATSVQSAFPEIYISDPKTCIALCAFHACAVLIADCRPEGNISDPLPISYEDTRNHARRICGISIHSGDPYVFVLSLWSIMAVASRLTIEQERQEIMGLLVKMESRGWDAVPNRLFFSKAWGLL